MASATPSRRRWASPTCLKEKPAPFSARFNPLLHTSRQITGDTCTADRAKDDDVMSMPSALTSPGRIAVVALGNTRRMLSTSPEATPRTRTSWSMSCLTSASRMVSTSSTGSSGAYLPLTMAATS